MKINSIQYLRAIAAILVVYCHAIDIQKLFGISEQQHFYFLQNFGAIGVDIFFIISGFIISYVSFNMEGKDGGALFLKKRLLRINPSYYLVSILVLLLNYFSKTNYSFPKEQAIKTFTILPIFETGYVFTYPIIVVGWTLAFEWLFYLFFVVLIFLKIRKRAIALVLIISALTLLSFLPGKNIQLTFISNPILWEFCFGVLIAMLYKYCNIGKGIAWLFLATGIFCYLLLIYFGYSGVSEATYILAGRYTWLRVGIWGIPSAILVIGFLYLEKSKAISFNNRTMLFLGDASFAIYLVHPRSLEWLYDTIKKFPALLHFLSMDVFVILLVTLSTLIGIVYYSVVEKRLNKYFTGLLKSKQNSKLQ
ncbi:acyltransferase [Taibaiella lutea]|uniref:Acyltransferase n=1 Tax=Taibaiella lutea TaxID=2608001 RepID=A0A5M6CEE0_9BACT|nr:acyltransferase [Taibaiella lutea]KAA5533534.1 acyltransferase [Taibaiella lutea]